MTINIAKIPITEIKKKNPYIVWIESIKEEICIAINKEKKFLIYSNICPHFGGIFNKPKLNKITCKFHGWVFDLKSGECEYPKSYKRKIKIYDYYIDQNNVVITNQKKL